MKSEIRDAFKQKDELNCKMYDLHLQLSNQMSPLTFSLLLNAIDSKIDFLRESISNRHRKKIDALISQKNNVSQDAPPHEHNFYPRISNLTSIQFTPSETALLNKGLRYNLPPTINDTDIKRVIADVKVATKLSNLNKSNVCKIALKTKEIITKEKSKNKKSNESEIVKNINNKLTMNKSIITKADKGNTLVVVSESDYVDKTLKFFSENDITEITKDPTPKFQSKIRKLIDENNFLFLPKEKTALKMMNPQLPKLRSQLKLHKPDMPISPIVNNMNCPSYNLNKKLNDILKAFYVFEENFSIKNSYELAQAIHNIDIPDNASFASLDITNLYTNIPITESIVIIKDNLLRNKIMNIGEITEFIELLENTLAFNYFSFNDKMYFQKEGLAMGNSLAGTIADIFVNHIELQFFKNNPQIKSNLIYYKRYVDDTLLLYKGSKDDLDSLTNSLNMAHPNLTFTIEHENCKSINFLDLTISNCNGKHCFTIYRKPTATDIIIHADSCHPMKYKRAFFKSMIHRILKLPLESDAIKKELNILKQIAESNGFKSNKVDALFHRLQQPRENLHNSRRKFTKMTYMGVLSDKINRLFKNTELTIAFTTNNLLQNRLRHTIGSQKDIYSNSGIYKLICDDCDKQYIGQTGRNFTVRFKEHTSNTSRSKSVFGQHLIHDGHCEGSISSNLKILHNAPKGLLLSTLEEIEIYAHHKNKPSSLLNEQLDFREKYFYDLFEDLL